MRDFWILTSKNNIFAFFIVGLLNNFSILFCSVDWLFKNIIFYSVAYLLKNFSPLLLSSWATQFFHTFRYSKCLKIIILYLSLDVNYSLEFPF